MRTVLRFALLAAAFALVTRAAGWWAVPVTAVVWTIIYRGPSSAPWKTGVAAIVAWGGILRWPAATAPLGELARRFAGVVGVPAFGLIVLTLVFGGALAWSASELTEQLQRRATHP
jgi:hypothetical protein